MKSIHYIPYFLFVALLGATIFSCDLANDIDKIKHPYVLEADKAITDTRSAELALAGVYSRLLIISGARFGVSDLCTYHSLLGITATIGQAPAGFFGFYHNRPAEGLLPYKALYNMILRSNFVIDGVTKLKESSQRKKEIIAEAKALRAMCHFFLLRLWGQFYDNSSEYGIVVRTHNKDKVRPRSTVAETYDVIYKDLDYAIAHAPDLRAKYYVSKTFAKGLKAKALLYQGKYAEAATLANEVISQKGDFDLSKNFADIFDHKTVGIYSTKELLFCVYPLKQGQHTGHEFINANNWNEPPQIATNVFFFSQEFINYALGISVNIGGQKVMYDGRRVRDWTIPKQPSQGQQIGKVPQIKKFITASVPGGKYETLYYLRMAEIYLIFAEAEARSKGSVSKEALDALNAVRKRAGATTTGKDGFETFPASITHAQFLEAVRMEKIMELFGEMGEHWFDLVRYDYVDWSGTGEFLSSKVLEVKKRSKRKTLPNKVQPHTFILPIPALAYYTTKGVVKLNPGYPIPPPPR